VYQSQVHDIEELMDIWHSLQQSSDSNQNLSCDSAIDGARDYVPANGPDTNILTEHGTQSEVITLRNTRLI